MSTNPTSLLLKIQAVGGRVWVAGDQLRYKLPDRVDARDLLGRLAGQKQELIELLRISSRPDPMATAHDRYQEAVAEVAKVWDDLRDRGVEPPWMDPTIETRLDDAIDARFRAGDPQGAIQCIERWRDAWMALLASRDALETTSGPRAALDLAARRLDGTQLFDLVDDPDVPEEDRGVYRSEILRRADDMVQELEGRRPHSNQEVHDMFARRTGEWPAKPEGGDQTK